MKNRTITQILLLAFGLFLGFAALSSAIAKPDHRADGSPKSRQAAAANPQTRVMQPYEIVSKALVNDDLKAAQSAALELTDVARQAGKTDVSEAAQKVANASSLEEARKAFKPLSNQVIALAKGNDGYTVMTCQMVEDGRWLQSGETVWNPYMGQKMPHCGMPASKKDNNMMKGMMIDGKMQKGTMMSGMSCCAKSESSDAASKENAKRDTSE